MKQIFFIWLSFFVFFRQQPAWGIGIRESKHIGKGINPLQLDVVMNLSGLLSETEKAKLLQYLNLQQEADISNHEIEHIIELLEKGNDSEAISSCIRQGIDLESILNIQSLRLSMLKRGKQFNPWFLREIAILPVVCGCLQNCLVNPKICQNVTYLIFLVDQLERNHHRIETKNDHAMLWEALLIIERQLTTLREQSSQLQKRLIDQAIEKLALIQSIHNLGDTTS